MVGILKDLIESFSSRIKNKILFNFALSWVVLNRSDILMLLFIDGINKKEILSKLFATKHFIDDLLWLLSLTVIFIFIVPFLNGCVKWIENKSINTFLVEQKYKSKKIKEKVQFEMENNDIAKNNKEIKELKRKAEAGDAKSQCDLGEMYYDGIKIDKNNRKAVYWWTQSADQGYAPAQNNLGVMYYNGKGVKKDPKKSIAWYQKAVEQGYVKAQYNLGYMYEKGKGVELDFVKAAYWYEKAAEQGITLAIEGINRIKEHLNIIKEELPKEQHEKSNQRNH